MKLFLVILLTSCFVFADTPPPGTVSIRGGTDSTKIGNTSDSLLVNITNTSIPVTGTFYQATQPVSIAATVTVTGALTDTQLRASAVPVSSSSLPLPTGASTSANQSTANGSLSSIDNKLTSPLAVTGTFYQVTQPVSGPLTDAQLRATAVPVSGTVSIGSDQSVNITQVGGSSLALGQQLATTSVPVVLTAAQISTLTPFSTVAATQSGTWNITNVSGTVSLPTGAATSANQSIANSSLSSIDTKIPSSLTVTSTRLLVDGSGVTQPVSAASLPLPTGASTSANQSTANTSLSTISSNQTGGSQKTQINNGADTAAVKAASTAAGATDPALVVAISPNNTIQIKDGLNATGSGSAAGATVSTVVTLTAPANAVGFVLMNLDVSTTNMRWAVGRTATTTLGQQLQPGRDTGFIPLGANVSIVAESGTCTYDIQWVAQ